MINKWNFQRSTQEDIAQANALSHALDISPVVCQLLLQRGIASEEEATKFFKPKLSDLHDPFLMPDMDKAVARLEMALGNKENILIYGDYDVDGTTAVALVYKYLNAITTHIDFYIPDRYDEGYGVSHKGIDYAAERGVKLIITLDCGIKAVDKVEYAKEKGIDVIICDHHMPDEVLPDAVAVLDAKRKDSIYPYEHLSGCGVGFKFMQAFAQNNNFPFSDLEKLLELAAISIASDIVPVLGENRILAYYGLKQINTNPSLGVRGLIDICGLNGKDITISDIVFKIGPRINASGRMMNGREAVELMLSKDIESAKAKSESIDHYNNERREMDKRITQEANDVIDELENIDENKAIIVFNPDWHKGVIGIVASRLTEKYYRPAIVLTKSGQLITGSARSIAGFDIYKAIESCRDLLENFGGHTYAAGLSLKEENFEEFKRRFLLMAAQDILPEQMVPQLDVDCLLELKNINYKFMNELKKMSPFGPDNMNPLFCSLDVVDCGTSRLVGKDHDHIKLEIMDTTATAPIHGIAFGLGKHGSLVKSKQPFHLCYTVEENTYNGNTSLQLMVRDIKAEHP